MLSNRKKLLSILGIILLLLLPFKVFSQPNYPTNPEQAQIVVEDLRNFIDAMENFTPEQDSIQVLNEFYFDRATVGMQEYVKRHQLTPRLLLDAIKSNPEKYLGIEAFLNKIQPIRANYRDHLRKFNELLPDALFPPTYLIVGANRGIAQASRYGQLVTVTRILESEEKLMKLMIHELSHFQQAMRIGEEKYVGLYSEPNNMLGICLREGGAEFITSFVLEEITQEQSVRYFEENEEDLKQRFQKDLESQNTDFWLWGSINQKKHPILLGYVMGYKICKTFYKTAEDKKLAVDAILAIDHPKQFLSDSGYFN